MLAQSVIGDIHTADCQSRNSVPNGCEKGAGYGDAKGVVKGLPKAALAAIAGRIQSLT